MRKSSKTVKSTKTTKPATKATVKTKATVRTPSVKTMLKGISRTDLKSNRQRVLFTLATSDGWVALSSMKSIANVGSRIRELRNVNKLNIVCKTASEINSTVKNRLETFYQLDTKSLTPSKVERIFEGVITGR